MTEADRMAQLIKLAVKQNQVTCETVWVNTDKAYEVDGEPTFWVSELGRYVSFDEMEYNTKVGRWFVK